MNENLQKVLKEINDFENEYVKNKKILTENLKIEFEKFSKEIFEKITSLNEIRWSQYTPYFNDGDVCEFRVNEVSFEGSDWSWYSWEEPQEISEQEMKLMDDFKSIIEGNQYFMLDIFGDHALIIITREGQKIKEFRHS